MSVEALEKLFGKEFVERYRAALAKAQTISREKLEEIRSFALNTIKDAPDFHVKYEKWDVILAQTPRNITESQTKETKAGNVKISMIWAGSKSVRSPFISVFVPTKEDATRLLSEPDRVWLLVGKLQEGSYEGDVTFSFSCRGFIELEAL
jgi:hypothetical protein